MLTTPSFLTILALAPLLSLSHRATDHTSNPIEPAHYLDHSGATQVASGYSHTGVDTVKRHRAGASSNVRAFRRSVGKRDVPDITVGGIDLDIVKRQRSVISKRSTDNGTLLPLDSKENTFIVPVSLGSPSVTYPLQLDLASSDLLIASTLCDDSSCPSSSDSVNPYYDVSAGSTGYEEINGNQSLWNTSYADGTVASGILAMETVTLGNSVISSQVIGLINSTNLTLSDQKISGLLGLGFPRLSTLARVLLPESVDSTNDTTTSTVANSTATGNATSTSATASESASATYFPTLLENLVRTPHLPYPVFALALSPPTEKLNSNSTSTTATATSTSSASARYQTSIGSLTLGGVSEMYVDDATGSGRTVGDIEWIDVVPFGQPSSSNDTTKDNTVTTSVESAVTGSSTTASATASTTADARRKRSDQSQLNSLPTSTEELSQEEYLYWTLALETISVNGTTITPNSSYASLGLPSVALLDVGFNGIVGPQQDVIKIFDAITDARMVSEGQWAVPCDTEMTLGFSFGGRYIQLQPSDWMYADVTSSEMCLAWPIAQANTGDGIDWQLGTPFLKNVYSIYSYGINGKQAPLVGFLPLDSIDTSSTNSSDKTTTSANTTTTTFDPDSPTPTSIGALSLTTTSNTALPNAVLSDPTFATPSYAYSATPTLLSVGVAQYEGLANASAYYVKDVDVISLDQSAVSSIAVGGSGDGGTASSQGGSSSGGRMQAELGIKVGAGVVLGGLGLGMALLQAI